MPTAENMAHKIYEIHIIIAYKTCRRLSSRPPCNGNNSSSNSSNSNNNNDDDNDNNIEKDNRKDKDNGNGLMDNVFGGYCRRSHSRSLLGNEVREVRLVTKKKIKREKKEKYVEEAEGERVAMV